MDLDEVKAAKRNPKTHDTAGIKASYKRFSAQDSPVLDERTKRLLSGHGRIEALVAMRDDGDKPPGGIELKGGKWLVPIQRGGRTKNDAEAEAYILAANKLTEVGGWDDGLLDEVLADWKLRKKQWLALGIDSGNGREEGLLGGLEALTKLKNANSKSRGTELRDCEKGTSLFDPVLTELILRWFSPKGGKVYDPFAGGSVRGAVAGILGRDYTGVDIREEQVLENRKNWKRIQAKRKGRSSGVVKWERANSETYSHKGTVDLVMSCPPYGDLEVYSSDPEDISTMSLEAFDESYLKIIRAATSALKNDRFAVFVVSEYRTKGGGYAGLVPKTIKAFEEAGLTFYNEGILIQEAGAVAMRAARPFKASRKLARTHQNILVFVKGDAKKAAKACGPVDAEMPEG